MWLTTTLRNLRNFVRSSTVARTATTGWNSKYPQLSVGRTGLPGNQSWQVTAGSVKMDLDEVDRATAHPSGPWMTDDGNLTALALGVGSTDLGTTKQRKWT